MNQELDKIYKERIKEISKNPYHFEKIDSISNTTLAYNPICGDKFQLYIDLGNEKVQSLHFHGFGCMLSKASTSILCSIVEGKNINNLIQITTEVVEQIENDKPILLEEMKVFSEHSSFKGRKDCILLSWKALKETLEKR